MRWSAYLIAAFTILSIAIILPQASAQPTWDLKIELLPAELYMGEWGTICANITNIDCKARSSLVIVLEGLHEDEIEEIEERIKLVEELGFVENHTITPLRLWGVGGDVYGDYEIYLHGVCRGRSIKVVGAGLWFPWKGYGRGVMSWENIGLELTAFDAARVVLEGADPSSSVKVCFKFFFPPDLPPEEKDVWPRIDVRLHFPGWIEYTLKNLPIGGEYVLQPYRSFNLTITDFDGVLRLGGAKVILRQLIHYYRIREYMVPENGTIRIWRLLDDRYEISIYWNSSYLVNTSLIFFERLSAYDLASMKVLKTKLFTVEISALDLRNRPLRGARVIFDGFEKIAENGTIAYTLVPEGNHTAEIYWRGVKVFDGWLWAGYHPTIYPWMTRPATEHILTLPVDDLIVQAISSGGDPVGANYTVIGPNEELSFENIYSEDGLLRLEQLPVAEYLVEATNCSTIFKKCVESRSTYIPGNLSRIVLPIHSARLRVLSNSRKPITSAEVALGPLKSISDEDGLASFIGIPEGAYRVAIRWRNLTVYEDEVMISKTVEIEAITSIYDIRIRFIALDGEEHPCNFKFKAPTGINLTVTHPSTELKVELVPEGECVLEIYSLEGRMLLEISENCSKLSKISEITLPIADMVIKVLWSDGEAIRKAEVIVLEDEEEKLVKNTDENGTAIFEKMILTNYTIRVNYPYTKLPLKTLEHQFDGKEIEILVEKASLTIRVLDSLGNPVEGADVTIFHGPIPLSKGLTDKSGVLLFARIPRLPSYKIKVRYDGEDLELSARPDEVVEVKVKALKPLIGIDLIQLMILAGVISGLVIIMVKAITYTKSKLKA